MKNYLKSLNPKPDESLIPGKTYDLWRNGEYLGTATWTEDENIGNSFQSQEVSEDGELINLVYTADTWKIVEN